MGTAISYFYDSDYKEFKGTRVVHGTIAPQSIGEFEYTISDDRLLLNGFNFKAFGSNPFDYVNLKIVIPVGHPYNETNGPIESAFVPEWAVSDDLQQIILYHAVIYQGFKIVVNYHNTGSTDVKFWANAFLHKVLL